MAKKRKAKISKKKLKKIKLKKILIPTCLLLIVLIIIYVYFKSIPEEPSPLKKTSEPLLEIISPLNITYHEKNVTLRASADEVMEWIVDSFDGGPNITECQYCDSYTLYYLKFEEGTHTITVYACTDEEKVYSKSVTFTVST